MLDIEYQLRGTFIIDFRGLNFFKKLKILNKGLS